MSMELKLTIFLESILKLFIKENKNFNLCFIGNDKLEFIESFKFLLANYLGMESDEAIYYYGDSLDIYVDKINRFENLLGLNVNKLNSLDYLSKEWIYIIQDTSYKIDSSYQAFYLDKIDSYQKELNYYDLNEEELVLKQDSKEPFINKIKKDSLIRGIIRDCLNLKCDDIEDFKIALSNRLVDYDFDFHYVTSDYLYLFLKRMISYKDKKIYDLLKNYLGKLESLKGQDLYLEIFKSYKDNYLISYLLNREHQRWMVRTLLYDRDDIYLIKPHFFVSFEDMYLDLIKKYPIQNNLKDTYKHDYLIYDFLDILGAMIII